MEILLAIIVVILVASILFFNRGSDGLDVNKDGKVDLEDAKKAVENTVVGVEETVKKAAVKPKGPGVSSAKTPAKRGRKPKKAE
jgi:hypothetical protein